MTTVLDQARSRGLIPAMIALDMIRFGADREPIGLASRLVEEGYTAGEVDAALFMGGRRAA